MAAPDSMTLAQRIDGYENLPPIGDDYSLYLADVKDPVYRERIQAQQLSGLRKYLLKERCPNG